MPQNKRIKVPSVGSEKLCGLCSIEEICEQYVELNNRERIFIGAIIFWACKSCSENLSPKYYKKNNFTEVILPIQEQMVLTI